MRILLAHTKRASGFVFVGLLFARTRDEILRMNVGGVTQDFGQPTGHIISSDFSFTCTLAGKKEIPKFYFCINPLALRKAPKKLGVREMSSHLFSGHRHFTLRLFDPF